MIKGEIKMLVDVKDKFAKLWAVKAIKDSVDAISKKLTSIEKNANDALSVAEDADKKANDNKNKLLEVEIIANEAKSATIQTMTDVSALEKKSVTYCDASKITVEFKTKMFAAFETSFKIASIGDKFSGKFVDDNNLFGVMYDGVRISDTEGVIFATFLYPGGQGGIMYLTRDSSIPSSDMLHVNTVWQSDAKVMLMTK